MAQRLKPKNSRQTSIRVGNISHVGGDVNVGERITIHKTVKGLSAAEVQGLFDHIYARIDARPETSAADREQLKAEVEEIQSTVTEAAAKKEKLDKGFLAERFRNIARTAPDILEVIVASLASPLAGLGVAVKKIAEKAAPS